MKISIITINKNNAKGLKKTIVSVINQTYSNIEYIVIDGGSTDQSMAVIKNSLRHINFWLSEKDNGMYEAMNKGLAKATGDYLLFLNSGDALFNSETISNAVQCFNNEDILYGNINIIGNEQIIRTQTFPESLNLIYFIKGAIPHQGMFIKKAVFTLTGPYDETLKICSDWKFKIDAICKYKCSYKYINLTIADYMEGGISDKTENQELIVKEKETVLINEYFLFKEDLEMIKEYKSLAFYYQDSKRVEFLKKIKFLKKILSGKYLYEYVPN